jgi:hypothetical protein
VAAIRGGELMVVEVLVTPHSTGKAGQGEVSYTRTLIMLEMLAPSFWIRVGNAYRSKL